VPVVPLVGPDGVDGVEMVSVGGEILTVSVPDQLETVEV